jgi:succinate dehydrogenase / fumarate reductase cytochrome b subunit
MDIQRQRPININPFSVQIPVPALVSISHRLSGLFLFFCLPALLWCLDLSLESEHGFSSLQNIIKHPIIGIFVWLGIAAFLFHLLAGIRHLLTDLGIGSSLKGGRLGAWLVWAIFIVALIFLGVRYRGIL